MKKFIQSAVFALAAAATSVAWSQVVPDLVDSTGRSIGQYVGDSVLVLYGGQVVRIYTDAHYDYSTGHPISSGLTWKFVPIYYQTLDCTGQAYIGGSVTAPTPQGNPTPSPGPAYTSPAYGSHFLFAPVKVGDGWIAYISWENPNFVPTLIQSERRYDGSCAQHTYLNLFTTPVITQVGLEIYGTPPFYVR